MNNRELLSWVQWISLYLLPLRVSGIIIWTAQELQNLHSTRSGLNNFRHKPHDAVFNVTVLSAVLSRCNDDFLKVKRLKWSTTPTTKWEKIYSCFPTAPVSTPLGLVRAHHFQARNHFHTSNKIELFLRWAANCFGVVTRHINACCCFW